jgi:hypothetical protein
MRSTQFRVQWGIWVRAVAETSLARIRDTLGFAHPWTARIRRAYVGSLGPALATSLKVLIFRLLSLTAQAKTRARRISAPSGEMLPIGAGIEAVILVEAASARRPPGPLSSSFRPSAKHQSTPVHAPGVARIG